MNKVLIGTTLSSGEFSLYVCINNDDEIFGAPGTPSLQEVVSMLTGIMAKSISVERGISEEDAFSELEIHSDCGLTTHQVPDVLDQFSTGDKTFCESHCADHAWHF
jgi:hypothetical protein